jgi:hypothetical protein
MPASQWVEGIRLLAVCAFLALGVAALRARDPGLRRRRINLFLVCTLIIHFEVGLTQIDCWPFSHYPLMRGVWNEHFRYERIFVVGLDPSAREWELDPMTWSPVFPLVLQAWFQLRFSDLPPEQKQEAARFLYGKAEGARKELAAGRRIGNERYLGSFTAPDWWLYRRATFTSSEPLSGIRVYKEAFRPAEKFADPNKTERVLLYEYLPTGSAAVRHHLSETDRRVE